MPRKFPGRVLDPATPITVSSIVVGGASITTDSNTGAIAFVPKPTVSNPDPIAAVVSPTGGITTVETTGGVASSNAIGAAASSNTATPIAIDITSTAPANGQALIWNADASKFVPGNVASGGGAASDIPKITGLIYPGSTLAAVPAGGETVYVTGSNFVSNCQIYINNSAAPSVTFVNSGNVGFTTPALTANVYPLYLVNPDGGTAIFIPGIEISSGPTWVTSATLSSFGTTSSVSRTLEATSDSTVTYTLAGGSSLPSGLSLASNGVLSGTLSSPPGSETTYNFSVVATDEELQTATRAFSITATVGIQATGGTETISGGYKIHTFTTSGTFNVTSGSGDIEYLVVAGGGGGGYAGWGGGGGGAGGLLQGNATVATAAYAVTIGAGGSGGASQYGSLGAGGANSSIIGTGVSITSVGGGQGSSALSSSGYGSPGGNGGSGGGAAQRNAPVAGGKGIYPGSSYIDATRQGYDGGGVTGGSDSGGGGGGAGGAGASTSGSAGAGGVGLQSSISGSAVFYAGGGGGGNQSSGALGGTGGGGNAGQNGTANRGGGGGGNNQSATRGTGGSGIVIIRYPYSG
ncbi:IPT/TIG domain-containing protein [bacterium]|nr:IPT/TIG domain-containing protein [bacterium]